MSARRIASAWLSAAILIGALGVPAHACDEDSEALFACETERAEKYIFLCARRAESGQGWVAAQYRFGKEHEPELVYPAKPEEGRQRLFFSHLRQGAEYRYTVRFVSGPYTYRISAGQRTDATPMRPESAGAAAVTVTDKSGKRIAAIACAERPSAYPDDLRQALACDKETPYGAAACATDPPTAKK